MKYFIDTEFLEGTQRESFPISLFRKNTPPTIDLISIGIVAEDDREYYAISKDFNLKEAWNRFNVSEQTSVEKYHGFSGSKTYWLRENVLKPIWRDLFFQADSCSGLSNRQTELFYVEVHAGDYDQYFTFESFKYMIGRFGKTNKEIAEDVKSFCSIGTAYSSMDKDIASIMHFIQLGSIELEKIKEKDLKFVFSAIPEFYAYYADYDWVVFCWLFGKMMDLPKGFPMYCNDLEQELDFRLKNFNVSSSKIDSIYKVEIANMPISERLFWIKNTVRNYPKQKKEHNAIEDARWNKKLYEFLNQL